MPLAVNPVPRSQPAVPLAGQQIHQRSVRPGPLVLGTTPLNSPTRTADRDRQFCYFRASEARRSGHFCLTLHVAMQLGLYLHERLRSVRRTVSEDSGWLVSSFHRTLRYRPAPFMERATSNNL